MIPAIEQIRRLNDELNAACIAGDMRLAYAKLQERRALEDAELARGASPVPVDKPPD